MSEKNFFAPGVELSSCCSLFFIRLSLWHARHESTESYEAMNSQIQSTHNQCHIKVREAGTLSFDFGIAKKILGKIYKLNYRGCTTDLELLLFPDLWHKLIFNEFLNKPKSCNGALKIILNENKNIDKDECQVYWLYSTESGVPSIETSIECKRKIKGYYPANSFLIMGVNPQKGYLEFNTGSQSNYNKLFMRVDFCFKIILRKKRPVLLIIREGRGKRLSLNIHLQHCKKNLLNCLQLTCRKSQEANVVTQTILQNDCAKNIYMQTCGVWMAAWMEHAACQLQSVEQVIFAVYIYTKISNERQKLSIKKTGMFPPICKITEAVCGHAFLHSLLACFLSFHALMLVFCSILLSLHESLDAYSFAWSCSKVQHSMFSWSPVYIHMGSTKSIHYIFFLFHLLFIKLNTPNMSPPFTSLSTPTSINHKLNHHQSHYRNLSNNITCLISPWKYQHIDQSFEKTFPFIKFRYKSFCHMEFFLKIKIKSVWISTKPNYFLLYPIGYNEGWLSTEIQEKEILPNGSIKLLLVADHSNTHHFPGDDVFKLTLDLTRLRNPPLLEATKDLTNLSYLNDLAVQPYIISAHVTQQPKAPILRLQVCMFLNFSSFYLFLLAPQSCVCPPHVHKIIHDWNIAVVASRPPLFPSHYLGGSIWIFQCASCCVWDSKQSQNPNDDVAVPHLLTRSPPRIPWGGTETWASVFHQNVLKKWICGVFVGLSLRCTAAYPLSNIFGLYRFGICILAGPIFVCIGNSILCSYGGCIIFIININTSLCTWKKKKKSASAHQHLGIGTTCNNICRILILWRLFFLAFQDCFRPQQDTDVVENTCYALTGWIWPRYAGRQSGLGKFPGNASRGHMSESDFDARVLPTIRGTSMAAPREDSGRQKASLNEDDHQECNIKTGCFDFLPQITRTNVSH
ncbi:uncharacterized protein VP01_81g1 [Puccinia sorghi]|uniref:Uncharacterized protein n=1 Tax=Puccinia sorghi TaxID=27349 RepID=A0A0L6UA00_9BASI|nr:uncharacterized protein VP01_81g1 [Puccinia sorghi]